MTEARLGYGALFKIADANSPTDFIVIGEITNITMPSISRDAIDATHMQSTEGWREFIAGLKDGGEVSVDLNYIPGSVADTLLMSQLATDTPTVCEIEIPHSPTWHWTFNAILTGLEPQAPVDDKMTATVSFKVTGKPTLGADS